MEVAPRGKGRILGNGGFLGARFSALERSENQCSGDARAQGLGQARPGNWSCESGQNLGDGLGGEDGAEDLHATGAFFADGNVDGKHPGEESGPADAGGCTDRRLVVSGKLERPTSLKQGELDDGKLGPSIAEGDGGAQVVAPSKDSSIANHVELGWWDEGGEASEQCVWGQLGEEGAAGSGLFEVEAHEPIGLQLHVVEGNGRPQHIGQLALQTFSVAAVEGWGGVQADPATFGEQGLGRRGLRWRRRAGGGEGTAQLEASGDTLEFGGVEVVAVVVVEHRVEVGIDAGNDGLHVV